MRRGVIVLGVLSQLNQPQYGYSLVTSMQEKGLEIDPGTLYPLLRRLEKQGLLVSEWDTNDTRPRKYYLLSSEGQQVFAQLCLDWQSLSESVNTLIGAEK
jgi:DNA-binding PadR family transcriptional regulator